MGHWAPQLMFKDNIARVWAQFRLVLSGIHQNALAAGFNLVCQLLHAAAALQMPYPTEAPTDAAYSHRACNHAPRNFIATWYLYYHWWALSFFQVLNRRPCRRVQHTTDALDDETAVTSNWIARCMTVQSHCKGWDGSKIAFHYALTLCVPRLPLPFWSREWSLG